MSGLAVALIIGSVVVFITSIFLLGFSFDTVDPQNYGLLCSTISKKCDSREYSGGRYFTWVSGYFLEFPRY